MPIAISTMSIPPLARYFPKSNGPSALFDATILPERPQEVGPIIDPDNAHKPIETFDEATHNANFTAKPSDVDADLPPPLPISFVDQYLQPSLTRNERLRLTMLWYHARDVVQDKEFLVQLQRKLELVHAFMGWEYAIVGLLNENTFTRVVTVGVPLAILPRRESTCSHTVNQPPGVRTPRLSVQSSTTN